MVVFHAKSVMFSDCHSEKHGDAEVIITRKSICVSLLPVSFYFLIFNSAVKAHQFFTEECWDSFKQIFDNYLFEASKVPLFFLDGLCIWVLSFIQITPADEVLLNIRTSTLNFDIRLLPLSQLMVCHCMSNTNFEESILKVGVCQSWSIVCLWLRILYF